MKAEEIMEVIDKATEPPMPKRDALALLEAIASEIEGRIDALQTELDDD